MDAPHIGDAHTCARDYGDAESIILGNDPDDQGRCEKVNIGMGSRPPAHKLKCHDVSDTKLKAQVYQANKSLSLF